MQLNVHHWVQKNKNGRLRGSKAGPPLYLGNRGSLALIEALPTVGETLQSIDMRANGLGNEAAKLLAAVLPECPNVTAVDLAQNNISNHGAQALLQAFRNHPSCLQLCIDLNPVPPYLRCKIREVTALKREQSLT